ncbi:hypothetical protein JK2ML_0473 [Mycobacterium leprae Kyoto-2]|uniref:Uncharacterized protein n=3 Tax=Mycobacterium leprae TaxID=1769 RepID=Q9CCT6_MYCLE|nr:hypothetical protein [Mycobacterium leprae]CAR70566.1 hypothetical protein MLBr00473 [Mycobacterium leprae Br4923]AWV47375.1 hypothetical protein DIJ64_02535 [Mycobacterium leprae]OAR20635.1 hypothetical protein A8144_10120 [Mycobacterium leprae 3125609]OAX70801.1 hypothetical protein A3216_09665 [Mycobacterium leprae 7935681]CAC29981.1 hypothetical protein [Mycobacterium leprae]
MRTVDVLITLSIGSSWSELGDQVQDALAEALLHPATWWADVVTDDFANLAEISSKLLMGLIGALAESHVGSVELVSLAWSQFGGSDVWYL